jgi:hypothetical protein
MTWMHESSTDGTCQRQVPSTIEDGPALLSYTCEGRAFSESRCWMMARSEENDRGPAAVGGSVTQSWRGVTP